jgi:hypothetical protein
MEVPESFNNLAYQLFLLTLESGEEPSEPTLEDLLKGIDAQGRKELFDYLNTILEQCDDEELQRLWFKTDSDFYFLDPRGTRHFLALVRDEMAKRPDLR